MSAAVRAWVREVDGKLVLTWRVLKGDAWVKGGERPLTFRERLAWKAAAKVPAP